MTVKIAVFAPMPSARVRTTAEVKTGVLAKRAQAETQIAKEKPHGDRL